MTSLDKLSKIWGIQEQLDEREKSKLLDRRLALLRLQHEQEALRKLAAVTDGGGGHLRDVRVEGRLRDRPAQDAAVQLDAPVRARVDSNQPQTTVKQVSDRATQTCFKKTWGRKYLV